MAACGQAISRGMWGLRHAGALWRGAAGMCTRVCWCRQIFTYIHKAEARAVLQLSGDFGLVW